MDDFYCVISLCKDENQCKFTPDNINTAKYTLLQ